LTPGLNYLVSADRFVDASGSVKARMVNRGGLDEQAYFQWLVRLEGTIE
jgi:hypothetical protein